jgi:hypothetical protein
MVAIRKGDRGFCWIVAMAEMTKSTVEGEKKTIQGFSSGFS